jgi:hypothetical protein
VERQENGQDAPEGQADGDAGKREEERVQEGTEKQPVPENREVVGEADEARV